MANTESLAKEIFYRYLRQQPNDRYAFLEEACSNNTLRREVEELLQCRDSLGTFLEEPISLGLAVAEGEDSGADTWERATSAIAPISTQLLVPGYEIMRELGRGGMGVVYLARQIHANRLVALKLLSTYSLSSEANRNRFQLEAQAIARLQHPGIVQIYEVGEHDQLPFFSLEYCSAGSLDQYLSGTPLPPQEAAELTLIVARAVAAAHEARIIHRDLKPANVLLKPREPTLPTVTGTGPTDSNRPPLSNFTIKLTDFGLSKQLDQETQTRTGIIMGTPSYMSPEQTQADSTITFAADVYSLGAVFYECLTGRPPFKAASGLETILQVTREEPAQPCQLQPGVPKDLETICLKCLHKDPARRYHSADALADDLQRFLDHRPITARSVGTLERGWRWMRRNPVVTSLLLTILGVSLAGAIASSTLLVIAQTNLTKAKFQKEKAETQTALAQKEKAEADRQKAEKQQALQVTESFGDFLVKDILGVARFRGIAGGLGTQVTIGEALRQAERRIPMRFEDQPLAEAKVRHAIGVTWNHLGNYGAAVRNFRRAVELREQASEQTPKRFSDLIESRLGLGLALSRMGNTKEAISLLLDCSNQVTDQLGEKHSLWFRARNRLALAYSDAGRHTQALQLHEETVQRRERVVNSKSLLEFRANLAVVYGQAGRNGDAVKLLKQVINDSVKVYGESHPYTQMFRSNLAQTYKRVGRMDDMFPLLEKTLKHWAVELGDDHPFTIGGRSDLATAYLRSGRHKDAMPLFERSLKQAESKLKSDHPLTLMIRNNLALVYTKVGEKEKAIEVYEQVLRRSGATLGEDHPRTIATRNNLASAYRSIGQLEKAISQFEKALTIAESKLGERHPTTLTLRNNLAATYWKQKRHDKSLPLFEQLLAVREKQLGRDHPGTLVTRANLGGNYIDAGQTKEGIRLLEKVIRQVERGQATLKHRFAWVGVKLAEGYDRVGKFSMSEPLYRVRYRQLAQQATKNPTAAATAAIALGMNLRQQKKHSEAVLFFREALNTLTAVLPRSWQQGDLESRLGEALYDAGDLEEAEKYLRSGRKNLERALSAKSLGRPGKSTRTQLMRLATERLIRFSEATGQNKEAAKWRQEYRKWAQPKRP